MIFAVAVAGKTSPTKDLLREGDRKSRLLAFVDETLLQSRPCSCSTMIMTMMDTSSFEITTALFQEMEESLQNNTRTKPLFMSGTSWMRPSMIRNRGLVDDTSNCFSLQHQQQHTRNAAERVIHALSTNTSVHNFILQNAEMDESLSDALAWSMARNQTLTSITLQKLTLTTATTTLESSENSGYYKIPSSVFSNMHQLQSVHLTQVCLDNEACQCLALLIKDSTKLSTLTFDDVHIDPSALPSLMNALAVSRSLEKLCFVKMPWGQDAIGKLLSSLAANQSIRHLALENLHLDESHTTITSSSSDDSSSSNSLADIIRHNDVMTTLSLRNNQLTATALRQLLPALQTNQTLRTLCLSRNPLGDASVPSILQLWRRSTLDDLCLVNTQLSASACTHLAHNLDSCALVNLRLDGNAMEHVADQVLQALRHGTNTTLHKILDRIPKRWGPLWKEVDFYLRANQAKRRLLLQPNSNNNDSAKLLYPAVLSGTGHQADVLYLFLQSSSPSRWSGAGLFIEEEKY